MKLTAVFAGQGAQFVGMGKDLSETYPECKDLFDRASKVLGYDLAKVCFEGPAEELTKSDICQPAIFVMSAACLTALQLKKPELKFDSVAGLSLGEWTALYAAGVLSFEDTVKVLEARGRFMQEACDATAGGMVSIMTLSKEQLEEVCEKTGVTMANINSDKQTVLSGTKEGVAAAEALSLEMGAKRAVVLNVAGAFHSPLMATAREKLAEVLESVSFNSPKLPMLSNVLGDFHSTDVEEIREAMLRQVTDSVRWGECVTTARASGVDGFVEMGPGKVLSGLIKRLDRAASLQNINDCASLDATVAKLS